VVRALLDRVPGLAGILHTVQPHPTLELLGPRLRLLWGRDHVEDEIAGFRVRVRPTSELPPSPAAAAVLVAAVKRAAALRRDETAVDLSATHPLFVLAMAQEAESCTGVTPTRRGIGDARDAAATNGITNATFFARNPLGVLRRAVARGRRPAAVVVTAQGQGLAPQAIGAIAAAGVPRVVYMARSLAVCARDLRKWEDAGYRLAGVSPIDLLPQTSHILCVAALRHAGA
jgi:23S rRNA (uracil1939-C5)-methyltransferase